MLSPPQWFIRIGIRKEFLEKYLTTDEITSFLLKERTQVSEEEKMVAERLVKQLPNIPMASQLKKLAKGQVLTGTERRYVELAHAFAIKESAFFGQFEQSNNYDLVQEKMKNLPNQFSYEALDAAAEKEGKASSTNNSFGMDNSFYNKNIRASLSRLKKSQTDLSYVVSPEYTDFQLLLSQLAELKMNVVFVIPPVSEKWSDYTGLSQEEYQKAVSKIKYQLSSQGFNHIVDFSQDGDQPYFMQDTIHMGWKGWVAFDKAITPFLINEQPAPSYHLRKEFLDSSWANYRGDVKDYLKE
ncbi:Poly(glycerophosphate chain) D-alanine transfer protein DltD [Streptococcus sp. DD13]|nr:Poly(glycerophosphate chain) D-alanine transfer protein DltD [Streptococcus sp. DD13]